MGNISPFTEHGLEILPLIFSVFCELLPFHIQQNNFIKLFGSIRFNPLPFEIISRITIHLSHVPSETATATLLLWLCYFFTLLVVYMLINWLPLLLVEQGFQPSQAAGVMFALQMGAASGTLMLGALMDKLRPVTMSLLIYSGMLASLLALGTVSSFNGMLLAGFVAGLFATGGQSVLYALAPLFYSSQIRATGVGTAVAVGRLGAMSGPLLAGKMLALGTGTVGVMAASAPGILVAGLAVFILMSRRSRMQPCADA